MYFIDIDLSEIQRLNDVLLIECRSCAHSELVQKTSSHPVAWCYQMNQSGWQQVVIGSLIYRAVCPKCIQLLKSGDSCMTNQYLSAQVQRVLRCVELMAGNEVDGVEPAKLAEALNTTPSDVTRILTNLEHASWAERLPANSKRWRLHKKPVQLSNTVEESFRNTLRTLQLEANNYSILG